MSGLPSDADEGVIENMRENPGIQDSPLKQLGPMSYEFYRGLLDRIYNAGATGKDHWKLKERVDDYVLTMIEHEVKKAQAESQE